MKNISLAALNQLCQNSAVSHLGIEFTAFGNDYLEAKVPVDSRTTQPFGLLHGGVSALLAETLASAAALLHCADDQLPVGVELNISHLRAVKQGFAVARAKPLHLGKNTQVWQVNVCDDEELLCAASRVTLKLINKKDKQ